MVAAVDSPPERPATKDPKELGFRPARMFGWLSPLGLLLTGADVIVSGLFARYADKRELEAALPVPSVPDLSADEEIWIDYAADVGDGFNSTYAIAHELAKDTLLLDDRGEVQVTHRGRILVMGGDQVYPTATEYRYHDRFIGPYRAALPWTPPQASPGMFVIPGNHDWYDGLTTFMRLFCRGRWVGGWATEQVRSYFAIKLPARWWLWGIDIQFDSYIDEPQLRFFQDLAAGRLDPAFPRVQRGDGLILCTGKPSWVHEGLAGDEEYKGSLQARRNLEFFEREIARASGAEVRLVLAGDLHHYAKYGRPDRITYRITSGGGGAYLYPTHVLPEVVHWQDEAPPAPRTPYHRQAVYPDMATSRRLRWGALLVPRTNPSFMPLAAALNLLILSIVLFGLAPGGHEPTQALRSANWWADALALLRNPAGLLFCLAIAGGLVVFADAVRIEEKLLMASLHTLAHLATAVTIVWAAAMIPGLTGRPYLATVAALVALGGGFIGSLVLGTYLVVTQLFKRHPNENFASQHIEDFKCFLRLRIRADGTVKVFPIGLDRVPRKWRLSTRTGPSDPWLEPVGEVLGPRLIDRPIELSLERGEANIDS
jgi:hypothetical protein